MEKEGFWPEHCEQRAFVDGVGWWQFHSQGSTLFPSERDEAAAEAIRRYGEPKEKAPHPKGNQAMTNVSVTVFLRVYDEKQFREAAYDRAIEDGLDEASAAQYKDQEEKSLSECAQMFIDPGISPSGAEILDSSSE